VEASENNLIVGKVLGEGTSGKVLAVVLKGENYAAKLHSDQQNYGYKKKRLEELEHWGKHPNIARHTGR